MATLGAMIDSAADLRFTQLVLRDRHLGLGARFAPFAGWEMPLQYRGIVAEHQAVRERAGVFDVSHLARVLVDHPQAAERLRSVTTFDLTALPAGKAHYSLYCNDAGGIEDDVFIYRLSDSRWLVIHNAANAGQDFERLRAVVGDAAQDITHETVMLAVQGPQAPALLGSVLGDGFLGLQPRDCAELDWRGASVLVARTGYTGEDGGECIAPLSHASALWDAVIAAGATPAGLGARDSLRLEAALPLHGNDIDPTTNPFEAGLGFAVSLDDGAPFIGRDALAAAKSQPLSRRLAHLAARGRGVPRRGYEIREPGGSGAGKAVGAVAALTSGGHSPSLRIGIGMAYLPADLARRGTMLEVDLRGRPLPVEVVRRPFYRKPKG